MKIACFNYRASDPFDRVFYLDVIADYVPIVDERWRSLFMVDPDGHPHVGVRIVDDNTVDITTEPEATGYQYLPKTARLTDTARIDGYASVLYAVQYHTVDRGGKDQVIYIPRLTFL